MPGLLAVSSARTQAIPEARGLANAIFLPSAIPPVPAGPRRGVRKTRQATDGPARSPRGRGSARLRPRANHVPG
ncbi:hypothetical protein CNY89_19975, partial [Amaricoccus sp. HAR-UPW-R2A-40]